MSIYTQQKPLNIVAVSGGLNNPSKTESLVQAILDELGQATPINVHFIKFSEIGHLLGGAIYRNQLPQRVQDDLAAVEAADALIVGTPVYRASFTGLFKHFFDFVEQTALVDVPVLLAASGGSDRHALVLEHQLRPLFSFFQAQTLPIGVYATDRDFTPEYTIKSEHIQDRITLAVARALPILEWAPAKGQRAEVVKAKTEQANQNLGINKQIEQDEVLPSAAIPNLDAAENRLHAKSKSPQSQVA
ncbi:MULTISPECIES: FMN reductase [Acinetobacter]|jgi:FMN reductase|uniref:FMN reductase n=3 Tax=Acinetobacter bereziniae TaxID=106648 RepID=A0A3R9YTI3_ACIBZ|nr:MULTISPECIES: FMN reductase [Acinetobacter]MEC8125022.1 FMN reductase [Pseudomonadota bacterium]ELW85313.1 FMN reductase [Acinetobacter sp. WC-743]ENV20681.1 FMN reductase [Acinetobacter bereziniae NIPH 3]ENV90444.1 FMN reductase [Acinetobacter bereziniae LMG 1003 = CIP 70.12]KKW78559.1 NADH-dependent FMN reductase [Acinetobacter sp. Ag2]